MRKMLLSAAILAATTVAMPASAAVVLTFTQGGNVNSLPGFFDTISNFDGIQAPMTGTAGVDYVIQSGSNTNGGALPNSSPTKTNYLAVLGGKSVTITLPTDTFAFAFDWGSLDKYNKLTISYTLVDVNGNEVVVPGSTFVNTPADGNQSLPLTNGLFQVSGSAGEVFKSITLSGSANSFEIDNLMAAVPEASTWAMMLVGLGAVGFAMRRQKVAVSFA